MSTEQRPAGGVGYPRTYQEFRSWFPDDDSCREYLGRLRWPGRLRVTSMRMRRAWRTLSTWFAAI